MAALVTAHVTENADCWPSSAGLEPSPSLPSPHHMAEGKMRSVIKQGAEARIYAENFYGKPSIVKERFKKSYRHPSLDEKLTRRRVGQEVRAIVRCRKAGILTPCVYFVDHETNSIFMEKMHNYYTAREIISDLLKKGTSEAANELDTIAKTIGITLAKMHDVDCIHGDLTTSNMLLKERLVDQITLIDFGLSTVSSLAEDKGVDLYVLERAFLSTHPNTEALFQVILDSYKKSAKKADGVIKKLDEVRMRGRKRTMVG
ncbi:EKC/KEOPS complex subunit TP53RK [Exaiptasia diaphana]|uniref:non-specific serine/threonine protein kinase n=1 Tax=Exaiptasia diaphana TaxID=2652724 RepID=A0A913X142_EXADI|nr:EKC/KEOPS complex subunit TP53RK [Exaiptasia diaphana]